MTDLSFYKGRRVFITGHTGFKGSWMCRCLLLAGAEVTGYSLCPPTEPALFTLAELSGIRTVTGDVRDGAALTAAMQQAAPEIVIHMAAQPIVRESYRDPVGTYETNVMGTVNLLEAVRHTSSVRSVVNVTTDKVYLNREWPWGYRECEELNGFDPYSNSKSCSELVTASYRNSFFGGRDGVRADGRDIAITTCRAGNVIGGGDFATDRIIPDCIRAVSAGEDITVRNPYSTRPYQHVLEPVIAYLRIAEAQYRDKTLAGCYNIGPSDADYYTTGELVTLFCEEWHRATGTEVHWRDLADGGPHEANFLKLDCSLARSVFHWQPRWCVREAMQRIIEWSLAYLRGELVAPLMDRQIREYLDADRQDG